MGATSFFAQGVVRGLFDIEVSPPRVIETIPQIKRNRPTRSFKVLCWNIYKGELFQKSPLPVVFEDYDLIFLQEDFESISPKFFPEDLYSYFVPTFKIETSYTGVSLKSSQKLTDVSPLLTFYREPFIITPKSSLIAKFNDILIVNTHAINFVTDDEWTYEIKRLEKEIDQHKAEKIIWAGDFNTWSDERLEKLRVITEKLGLTEVTFKEDHRVTHIGIIIDYIFIKGLKVKNSQTYEASEYSDHNPLSIEILIE